MSESERRAVRRMFVRERGSLWASLPSRLWPLLLGGAAALALRWRAPGGLVAPAAALVASAVVFVLLLVPSLRSHSARRRRARERWGPVLDKGQVEIVSAEPHGVIELETRNDLGWFIGVDEGKVLFSYWRPGVDPERFPSRRIEIVRVPGLGEVLEMRGFGERVAPQRRRAGVRVREYEPDDGEIFEARLASLDEDLAALRLRGFQSAAFKSRRALADPRRARLAEAVEELGFYKYVTPQKVDEARAEIVRSIGSWLARARRAYRADREWLGSAALPALLEDMEAVLEAEGAARLRTADSEAIAFAIAPGGRREVVRLAVAAGRFARERERAVDAANALLERLGSPERVYLVRGGELDDWALLLTPELRARIEASKLARGVSWPPPAPRS